MSLSEPQGNTLLECSELLFGYKVANCLCEAFDFELRAGEVVSLMGENGCGKSTLLKTMAGMIQPLSGTVSLQKENLVEISPRKRAQRIALVRMNGMAPDRMTVREFVSLGRSPYAGILDGRSEDDERAIDESLDLLELRNFENRLVANLSDGERSRVYLAEAVAQQVRVLLLDEPNAFLDIPRSHKLFRMLRKLSFERKMGIVVSTHSVEYAERYSDRMMVIHDGLMRIENTGDARAKGLLDWTE